MKIIAPHRIKSREVVESDLTRVILAAEIMHSLCHEPHGIYKGGLAVAHQQITDKDPLCFFVTRLNEIYINPVIVRHTKMPVDSKEGCLSFENREQAIVQRWNKCQIESKYILWSDKEKEYLFTDIKLKAIGELSKVFQHEIDHFDCKYIYDF